MPLNPTSTQKIQTIKKHILTQAQYDQLVSDGYVTSHPYEEYYITDANNILNDLDDINITNPTNGQTLVFDVASQKWINGSGGGSGITGHDYTHQPDTGTPVSGSQTITYAVNTRGSKTITASGNLTLDFIVNNGADNLLWIINNSGSTIDIAINSVISNNVQQFVFLPENGIDVDNNYVCEIGVIVNANGAYITFRNDLMLQQIQ